MINPGGIPNSFMSLTNGAFANGQHFFNGSYLDQQTIVELQVQSKRFLTLKWFVPNRDYVLILDSIPSQWEFDRQASFVDRFK